MDKMRKKGTLNGVMLLLLVIGLVACSAIVIIAASALWKVG